MKYTNEQKVEALKSIKEYGVSKTADMMKISAQTLYNWRRDEAKEKKQHVKPHNGIAQKVHELLENDHQMQEKITQLELENHSMREIIARYRSILYAVLDTSNEFG